MSENTQTPAILHAWDSVIRYIAGDRAHEFVGRSKETLVFRRLRTELERLDPRLRIIGPDMQETFNSWHIDLVVAHEATRVAVEGKYKVLTDGAIPDNRKAAFFDLHKLETYVASRQYSSGWFLWLTNQRSYLEPATGDSADFSTHDGRRYLSGTPLSAQRARNRDMPLPLVLSRNYFFKWQAIDGTDWFNLVLQV